MAEKLQVLKAKNSTSLSIGDKGIRDLLNIATPNEIDEILQNPPANPSVFEVLRCYVENLEHTDTKHIARYIFDFCFHCAVENPDPVFLCKAAEAVIACLSYTTTDKMEFNNSEFFGALIEFAQSGYNNTVSIIFLNSIFLKIGINSIDYLTEEDIVSVFGLLNELQNTIIEAKEDKTDISDLSAFLTTSFASSLVEIPQNSEILENISQNIQLGLSSRHVEVVNFILGRAYSLILGGNEISIQIPSYEAFGIAVMPGILNMSTVLPVECFEGQVYPFSFENILEFSMPNCSFYIIAERAFRHLSSAGSFSDEEDAAYFTTLFELIRSEESSGENVIDFNYKIETLTTLCLFDAKILIANPECIEVFYRFALNSDDFSKAIFLVGILRGILEAIMENNQTFIGEFVEQTAEVLDDLNELANNQNPQVFTNSSRIIDIFNSLTE